MALNYKPSVLERIGGPWALTLRAYLWTSPITVIFQPIIEPGFWSGNESRLTWFAVCLIGYLVFGAYIFIANKFLVPNREDKPVSGVLMILIGMIGGAIRGGTIGTLIPVLGLTGTNGIERLPFATIIGGIWIVTTSLIMDAKYRYQRQLNELVIEQNSLVGQQRLYLAKFTDAIPALSKPEFDLRNFKLQNIFRDLAVRAGADPGNWGLIARQVYSAVTDLIFVSKKPSRVSELPHEQFFSSRKDAFNVISRTPLFHIPTVFSLYLTLIVFSAARILPIKLAAFSLTIGMLVNLSILILSKKAIQRSKRNSSFIYINMFVVLTLLAIIGPTFSRGDYVSVFELQVFAIAGTVIEVIWIVATGLLMLSQVNRQKIIDQASIENELLRLENQYWVSISQQVTDANYSPLFTLNLVSSDLSSYLDADQPAKTRGAIEFASSLTAEIKAIRNSIDIFSIESEFDRIVATWGKETNILWTHNGVGCPELVARRAIAAIEISILKSLRYGQANLISIDLVSSSNGIDFSVNDNGGPHGTTGAAIGNEILMDLTSGTYKSVRKGSLTIATSTLS